MIKHSGIRNIIFDLSEVLLTGIQGTGLALVEKHKLKEALVHNVPWTKMQTPLLIPLVEELFYGNIDENTYIEAVIKAYPQIGDSKYLKQHIRENFKEVEGTREIILELKRLGYILAILSVHTKEWIDYCEKHFDFHKLFDVRMYSYDMKVSKPHPSSFQKTLEALKARPEECIFIDDSEINIKAAASLGIPSLLFTNATNLRAQLKEALPDFGPKSPDATC